MTSLESSEAVGSSQPIPEALAEALRDYEFSLVVAEVNSNDVTGTGLPLF
jgi:hypothetical protein